MDEGIRPRLKEPSLRAFGLVLGALLSFFAWRWHRKGWAAAPWVLGAGGACALAALLRPSALAPVERGWRPVAKTLARVNTTVALTLLYWLVLTPYALVARLFSSDPLESRPKDAATYWKRREKPRESASYERMF